MTNPIRVLGAYAGKYTTEFMDGVRLAQRLMDQDMPAATSGLATSQEGEQQFQDTNIINTQLDLSTLTDKSAPTPVESILNYVNSLPGGKPVASVGGFLIGIGERALTNSSIEETFENLLVRAKKLGETVIENFNNQRFTDHLISDGEAVQIEQAQVIVDVSEHLGVDDAASHQRRVIAHVKAKSLLREAQKLHPMVEDKILSLKHAMYELSSDTFESVGLNKEQSKLLRKYLPEF